VVDDAADDQCGAAAAAERDELPGGDPRDAVLRSEGRSGGELRSIGAIIGHEISHGFDDTGAEFDAQGRLANWWTPEDAKHFKQRRRSSPTSTARTSRCPGCMSTAS
jgi:hypothetical protein